MAWTTTTSTQVRVARSFLLKSCRNFKWSTVAFQQSRAEPREVRSMSSLVLGRTRFTATRSYLRRTAHSMRATRSKPSPASHHLGASVLGLLWADLSLLTKRFTTPPSNKNTTEGKSGRILTLLRHQP